jgi:hypothetical protein
VFPRLTNVDRLLLEYDTPRAGDFGPLRHVRAGAEVVLGLLTTKQGTLEDAVRLRVGGGRQPARAGRAGGQAPARRRRRTQGLARIDSSPSHGRRLVDRQYFWIIIIK